MTVASGAIIAVVAVGGIAETGMIVHLAPITILAGFFLVPRAIVLFIAAQVGTMLLDLTMPRMNGQEACGEMHRLRPEIPVILTSGYDEQEVNKSFAGQKVAGFLQKPYELATLATKLQAVLQ